MTSTLKLAIDARKAKSGANEFDRASKKVRSGAKQAATGVERLEKRTKALGVSLRSVTGPLAGFFGAFSGALILRDVSNTVKDFEETMATLKGVVGANEKEFVLLSASARELGATTRFSAQEAGEGLLFLARAGFSVTEAVTALPGVLNFATAGALGLGEAADIASNVLKAFKLEVEETERVADVLVNTANNANTDVRQLAEAMKFAAPFAAALGISVEQTSSFIGALGDAGIQASMAGTNLRGIMAALIGPTKGAERAFKRMGLTLEDVNPSGGDLIEVFKGLEGAQFGASEASQIFGRRNAAAALVLASSTEKLEELTRKNEEAEEVSKRIAKIMDDTLSGSYKNLRSVTEEASLALGDRGFGGGLKKVVDSITDAIRVLVGMEEKVQGNAKSAVILAGVFKILLGTLTLMAGLKTASLFSSLAVSMAKAGKATLLLNAGFSSLLLSLTLIGATAASVKIGFFLREEFKVVRVSAHVTAIFLLKQWENIKFGAEVAFIGLGAVWEKVLNNMRISAALVVSKIGSLFLDLERLSPNITAKFGLEGLGGSVNEVAKELLDSIEESDQKIAQRFLKATQDRQKALKSIEQADKNIRLDIEEEFGGKTRKGVDFFDSVKEDIDSLTKKFNDFNIGVGSSSEILKRLQEELKQLNEINLFDQNELERFKRELEEIEEREKTLVTISDQVGNAFTNSLDRAIEGGITLKQLITDLAKDISKITLRNLITQPAGQAVSSGIQSLFGVGGGGNVPGVDPSFLPGGQNFVGPVQPNARGNVFRSGHVVPFQRGGIVTSPLTFPMSGGRTGLMGESGPEAVIPLTRDSQGRLGVRNEGDRPSKVVNNNITMNVTTSDAASFRQSKAQILSDLRSGISSRT